METVIEDLAPVAAIVFLFIIMAVIAFVARVAYLTIKENENDYDFW